VTFIPNDVVGGTQTQHAQASPDAVDFSILLAADTGLGVVSGLAVTPNNSGVSLNVNVAAGVVLSNGAQFPIAAVTNLAVAAANATNPRFDLVVTTTTTVSVVTGTAAANPVFPALPANSVALAAIYVPANATSITAASLVDKRVFMSLARNYASRIYARASWR
jgi:divalent metal cation (Fe/Co/Zn/Cd) transporter